MRAITVYYENGAGDTISAGTVATLPDGTTTTFSRTTAVYVIYTVVGSGRLYATPESQLPAISGDWAGILRVLRHGIEPYQPSQPGGAAIKSGAWSGGASVGVGRGITGGGYYGVFDSQSIQGGGYVSGLPFYWSTDSAAHSSGGFFLKIPSSPPMTYTLWDLNLGPQGYLRVKLTAARHILYEVSVNSGALSLDLTPSTPIALNTWSWITFTTYSTDGNQSPYNNGFNSRVFLYGGAVYIPGGTSPDGAVGGVPPSHWYIVEGSLGNQYTYSGKMGWGVATSDGTSSFPNSAGWEMSKLYLTTVGSANSGGPVYPVTGLLGQPSSDPGSGYARYLCRQPVGAITTTLTDSSGNGYHLTPGASGCAIVADGPFI